MWKLRLWLWPSQTLSCQMKRHPSWRVEASRCPEPPLLNSPTSLKVVVICQCWTLIKACLKKYIYIFFLWSKLTARHSCYIHDLNLPFPCIPKVLCWFDIRWLWRPFEFSELSCSRTESDMISTLWHGELSCWKWPSEDGYSVVTQRWTLSATVLTCGCGV